MEAYYDIQSIRDVTFVCVTGNKMELSSSDRLVIFDILGDGKEEYCESVWSVKEPEVEEKLKNIGCKKSEYAKGVLDYFVENYLEELEE